MKARIVVLPGDGIGVEVTSAAVQVLERVAGRFGHDFAFEEALIGGIAIDTAGSPLPPETLKLGEQSDAILLGAVGGPKWDNPTASLRPEQGLLGIRKHFGLFANLRPVKAYPALANYVPLRPELLEGVDMLFVRELTGGIYFGARQEQGDSDVAYDTEIYSVPEVQRIALVAMQAAQGRRRKVTSVDKANVLASSRLWRRTVVAVHEEFQEIALDHVLVDAATMYLITRPASFDVVVAGNMFGDILTDEASVLASSIGLLPSASIGAMRGLGDQRRRGVFEPIHGSAPALAGTGRANPVGTILSLALLFRLSLLRDDIATAIESAVAQVISGGQRTPDIAEKGSHVLTTAEFGAVVAKALQ